MAGCFGSLSQFLDDDARFTAAHVCICSTKIRGNGIGISKRRYAWRGQSALNAVLVHNDPNDFGRRGVGWKLRDKSSHHVFPVSHLLQLSWGNKAHGVDVR